MKIVLSLFTLLLSFNGLAQTNALQSEKAQFMLNITRYVRWENRNDLGKTFDIAVVRSKDMAKELRKLSYKKTVLGKKIKIVEFYKLDEIETCDMVYLSKDVYINDKTIMVVKSKIAKSTLIVTDNAPRVGMINFLVQSGHSGLTYEINQKNIENAQIIPLPSFLKSKKSRIKNDVIE